jgi:hypothetical protein
MGSGVPADTATVLARATRSPRAIASVPMLKDGRPIGTITVGQPKTGCFFPRQIASLRTFYRSSCHRHRECATVRSRSGVQALAAGVTRISNGNQRIDRDPQPPADRLTSPKIESGQFTFNMTEFAIESVVETVRADTKSLAQTKETCAQDRGGEAATGSATSSGGRLEYQGQAGNRPRARHRQADRGDAWWTHLGGNRFWVKARI